MSGRESPPNLQMALEQYRRKRSPERTPEPYGREISSTSLARAGMFVVQEHAARRLHYDFRLEIEGVLKSWPIPKGPSLDPRERRLAVMVEDHPMEYADFEGVIPPGNYGAGAVIVWDRGVYRVIDPPNGDPAEALRAGKLSIELHGFKLRGAFALVRTRLTGGGKENWLFIKKRDEYATSEDVTALHPRSVLSGLTVEEMRDAGRVGEQAIGELSKMGVPRFAGRFAPRLFPLSLAKLAREPFDGESWLFEMKYDGVRSLAIRDGGPVRLYARSGAEITGRYPELALAFNALPFDRFVMDGEIVALSDDGRPDFQRLQKRMHVEDAPTARRLSLWMPVVEFVFDLLAFDGFDLRPLGCEKRKQILQKLIRGEGPIRYCDHIIGRGRDFFQAVSEVGLEGIVAKRRDSAYVGRRNSGWIKIKCPVARRFVVGGFTDPEGSRSYFGALMLGLYESDGSLRFVGKVGTGFSDQTLEEVYGVLASRIRRESPFRRARREERPAPSRRVHFVEPELVAEVRFADVTQDGCVRHPSFVRLVEGAEPRQCTVESAFGTSGQISMRNEESPMPSEAPGKTERSGRDLKISNPDKIFWPAERYTKRDLIDYYRAVARWMLPYLKDRPVMIVRYPDGIEGKSFYQKDAPDFAPDWIRTEKIYSEESGRNIDYFVLESEDALAYVANLGAIPIHVWSSRIPHLDRPDWLLFDIDPKGSTPAKAVSVAREIIKLLGEIGLKVSVKTSGQAGIHVMVGIKPAYTYEQARNFAEIIARLVANRVPEIATVERNTELRKGRAYIDYLQLGYSKTIAAPYTVRPIPGAPVSAPIRQSELRPGLDPGAFTIKTMPRRIARMRRDPFIGALVDQQEIERSLEILAKEYREAGLG